MVVKRISRRLAVSGLAAALFVSLSGCASVTVPAEQVELTRNAVSRAVSADATQFAPMEMKSAQDKLYQLERALGAEDFTQARLLAEQAEADANLAERKALARQAQTQLQQAQQGIEVLKQEMLQAPDATAPTSR